MDGNGCRQGVDGATEALVTRPVMRQALERRRNAVGAGEPRPNSWDIVFNSDWSG
jgi:hypothetical protein